MSVAYTDTKQPAGTAEIEGLYVEALGALWGIANRHRGFVDGSADSVGIETSDGEAVYPFNQPEGHITASLSFAAYREREPFGLQVCQRRSPGPEPHDPLDGLYVRRRNARDGIVFHIGAKVLHAGFLLRAEEPGDEAPDPDDRSDDSVISTADRIVGAIVSGGFGSQGCTREWSVSAVVDDQGGIDVIEAVSYYDDENDQCIDSFPLLSVRVGNVEDVYGVDWPADDPVLSELNDAELAEWVNELVLGQVTDDFSESGNVLAALRRVLGVCSAMEGSLDGWSHARGSA